MHRKSQGSTKYSRNERLAQLSEQESVIEKKKREIFARVEAQKKKETEALEKLEQSNIGFYVVKKDNILPFNNNSSSRRKDVEEEEQVISLRNVFSNDGSFLDKFKKLSSSMDKKKVEFLTPSNVTKSLKIPDCEEKLETNHKKKQIIWDNYERKECELDEDKKIPHKKMQNSNIHHQLLPLGLDEPIPKHPKTATLSSMSNHQVLTLNTSSAQWKTVSPQLTVEYPKSVLSQPNINLIGDASLSSSEIPIEPIDAITSSRKAEYAPAETSFQVQTPPTTCETYQPKSSYTYIESSQLNISGQSILDMEREKTKSNNEGRLTQFYSYQKSTINSPSNPVLRVSPALTGDEEKNRDENQLRDALCQERERAVTLTQSHGSNGSPSKEFEPDGLLKKERNTNDLVVVEEMLNWRKKVDKNSIYDSTNSESNSRDSNHHNTKLSNKDGIEKSIGNSNVYQADCSDETKYYNCDQIQNKSIHQKYPTNDFRLCKKDLKNPEECRNLKGENLSSKDRQKRKRKSRWGDELVQSNSANAGSDANVRLSANNAEVFCKTSMLSKLTRSDPGLIQYARQAFGSTNLNEEDWKKAEDHYKINLLYQDMVKKRAEIEKLEKAGKFKYEYDSDEDVEGGTWEHKLRQQEMMATQLWAEELTRQAAGKHHIGDFLPPEELERFMEKYNAVKQGRNPDLSDYKEFKLKEDNVGYRLLQKMGWNEGQGLGQDGNGITNPINKASSRLENRGLGVDRPDGLQAGDDEYDAYRKRMMLAYRFRPNPLNNPRRPYY